MLARRMSLFRSCLVALVLCHLWVASASAGLATTTTTISQPTTTLTETTTTTLFVAQATPGGICGDANRDGRVLASDALLTLRNSVGTDTSPPCTPLVCDTTGSSDGLTASDALGALRFAVGLIDAEQLTCPTVARYWDDVLLDAIRLDTPRPTVHARNLFHLSIALWDIWTIYEQENPGLPYLSVEPAQSVDDADAARTVAMSYAAYRILEHRFVNSPNAGITLADFEEAMAALLLDPSITTTEGDSPEAVGNRVAAEVLAFGASDGANEVNDYADDTGYQVVNDPLVVEFPGTDMNDPNRWQPLSLDSFVTQNGIVLPLDVQEFISPNWDGVAPFALVRAGFGVPYVDPGLPPQLGGEGDEAFKEAVLEVIRFSSIMDPDDGVTMDISPGALGNNPLGTSDGNGHELNPFTQEPYEPNVVLRGDYGRILAEFWADGPDSETPPGHWNTLANYVTDHELVSKRVAGEGPVLDDLEWDVKLYLALNGAVHDAAVAAWGAKAIYDYSRPISMIRHMGGLGQSSDPDGTFFHPDGLPLEPGLVEQVTEESSAPGQRHEHLSFHVGEVAIFAWAGNPEDPETEFSGAAWQLAVDWVPYQRETFVTPAFAAYVSGHSTFSRAGAEVLTRMTGTPFFPGGMGTFLAPKDEFLEFETGPTEDIVLQWATYQDAADEAGISRLYGGIHVRADDFEGRIMGFQIGQDAFDLATVYWNQSLGE